MNTKHVVEKLKTKIAAIEDRKREAIERAKAKLELAERRTRLLDIGEMAKQMDIDPTYFRLLINRGVVSGPTHTQPGLPRRYYNFDDIDKLQKERQHHRENQTDLEPPAIRYAEKRRALGYFTRMDVVRNSGVSVATIQHHIDYGHIPRPTHRCEIATGRFYTADEYKYVMKWVKANTPNATKYRERKAK